ncbi:MAG: TIGR01212 family radical SAM protein [Bacteroidales bacterium]|nr:TIGR01212 family radical SAM protein [Bacteroidales bacterium]
MADILYTWGHNRPFNAYSNYMRKVFSERIQKLSIDAGFTCPNRDGKLSKQGCTFCSNDAFNPSYCRRYESITVQIEEGIKFHSWRYKNVDKYLAYFQPYSNTYASLDVLKARYEEALAHPKIVGLVIGTRPDCVDDEKLDYLAELNEKYHIVVEYGIESCYDATLKWINRGHTFAKTVKAIEETHKRGLETGGHLIFGFPCESRKDMLAEADILSSLPIDNLKFHQLQILDNTPMNEDYLYNKENYKFFSFDEYVEFIISFLERLNPDIIIERFASEVPPRYNIGQSWGSIRNEQIVQKIEQKMISMKTYQGRLYFPDKEKL